MGVIPLGQLQEYEKKNRPQTSLISNIIGSFLNIAIVREYI